MAEILAGIYGPLLDELNGLTSSTPPGLCSTSTDKYCRLRSRCPTGSSGRGTADASSSWPGSQGPSKCCGWKSKYSDSTVPTPVLRSPPPPLPTLLIILSIRTLLPS